MFNWLSKIENKVIGATAGGGFGAAVSTAILWALGVYAWGAPSTAAGNDAAVASVPKAIAELVPIIVGALGAFIGGYVVPPSNNAGNPLSKFSANASPEPDVLGPVLNEETGDAGMPWADTGAQVGPDTDDWQTPQAIAE